MGGQVFLVGAGPGDPELITLKGRRLLESAEVVIYDRLVDPRLLRWAAKAEVIYAGKGKRERAAEQEEINELLVHHARRGKRVVRLKGGDPFVLGRGGEEAEALVEAGIPFEVVPGITSAIAVPAYAGIPVTHRDLASSVTIITGHEAEGRGQSRIAWDKLAIAADTLVILMGLENLQTLAERLVQYGRPATTPAALIRWGSLPRQKTVVGTLADISLKALEAGMAPPAILVVGEVVRLRDKLSWFEKKPLFGRRVLVTRATAQASQLSQLLSESGAEVVELPAIETLSQPQLLDKALGHLEKFDWIIFTSPNGVEAFCDRLFASGKDSRVMARSRVAAIGPATAQSLKGFGILADLVPQDYSTPGLIAALKGKITPGNHVLLPRSSLADKELVTALHHMGAEVEQVDAYVTRFTQSNGVDLENIDVVTFTSSSTVKGLHSRLGNWELIQGAVVAAIGQATAKACAQLGLKVDVVASEHTIPGLVKALINYITKG